ncbi:hypothetical protein HII31_05710 [Pseudocercospora fuligena]|uniref:Uncharacterized protein n=1 Tax=Pseudocercospora fuligena TaxID=685502 RepID=A0A8H6RL14_9PEZI|nr:hypothetical protein HII31_05710 [Pseudocercospora fuligena]
MAGPLSNSNGDHSSFSSDAQFNGNPAVWPTTPAPRAASAHSEQPQDAAVHQSSQVPIYAATEPMRGTWSGTDHEQQHLDFPDAENEVTVVFPGLLGPNTSPKITSTPRNLVRLEHELSGYGLQLFQDVYANPQPALGDISFVSPEVLLNEAVAHLRATIHDFPPIEEFAVHVFNNQDEFENDPSHSFPDIMARLLQVASEMMEGRATFDVGSLTRTGDGWRFTIEHASPDVEASHLLVVCGHVARNGSHGEVSSEVWKAFTVPARFGATEAETQFTQGTASAGMPAPYVGAGVNMPALTLRPNALPQPQPRSRRTSDSSEEPKTTTSRTDQMPKDPHAYTGEEFKDVADADLLNGTIHTDKIFGELAGRIAKACGGDKQIQQKINHLRVNVEGQQAQSKGCFTHRLKLWYKRKAADSNGMFTEDQFKARFLEERYGKPVHAARLHNKGQYKPGANLSAKTLAKRKRSRSASEDGVSDEGEVSPDMAPRKKRSVSK